MEFKITIVVILVEVFLIERRCAEDVQRANPTSHNNPDSCMNSNAFISPDQYPAARRNETVEDTYANVKSPTGHTVVKDPYRWLENAESSETNDFIKKQMNITKSYLNQFPFRAELTAHLKDIWNYPKYGGLIQAGNKYFSFQNTGLQSQGVMYIHDTMNANDTGRIFFDPNKLSEDGSITLASDPGTNNYLFSDDGQVFAYLTSEKGSDWRTLQFLNVEEGGPVYKEKLTKIKFTSISFTKDGKGIFYSGFPDFKGKGDGAENEKVTNQKLMYHVLGTEQSKDVIVADYPENPEYLVSGAVTDDGMYLIVFISGGTGGSMVYIANLDTKQHKITGKLKLQPIVTTMDADYICLTNNRTKFTFMTNKDADNYKIVTVDIANLETGRNSWSELIAEDQNRTLEWANVAWDKYLLLGYIEDVKSVVQLHDVGNGKMLKKFKLDIGHVDSDSVFADQEYKDIFFTLESFYTPATIYHCDLSKSSFDLEVFKEINVKNFNKTKYTTEQVFYHSKDGTRIPMFLLYKKGLKKDGKNFALLSAYGSYGETQLPSFGIGRLIELENFNGVRAIANIRGGGEYGEKWHRAGMLHNRQNGFDDFQAAAQFLIDEKYTSAKFLAINGGSAGGTLIGACLNQRPDLFGAVIADVGVMDMLRYDLFTGGQYSVDEWGTARNATDFPYLYAYSPLHNVNLKKCRAPQYPATMLTTSDHDDRVPPLHSLKMIATLQYQAKSAPNQKNPLIISVETNAGHYGATTTDKAIASLVDFFSFISIATGAQYHSSPSAAQTAKYK